MVGPKLPLPGTSMALAPRTRSKQLPIPSVNPITPFGIEHFETSSVNSIAPSSDSIVTVHPVLVDHIFSSLDYEPPSSDLAISFDHSLFNQILSSISRQMAKIDGGLPSRLVQHMVNEAVGSPHVFSTLNPN